ncbi:hypothetical protein ACFUTX_11460 [Microbacterium sp. NPDC057407]|uniref:hypothetical protein n=1 Tax=Microbacterium sp. NPDC057407 TaxID=3346120 RepID=UPI003672834F
MDTVVRESGRWDAATRAELANLRRRAFGRAADIAADPRALRRLIELEDALVQARAGAPAPIPHAEPAPTEPSASDPAQADPAPADAAPAEASALPASPPAAEASAPAAAARAPRPPARRRLAFLSAASVTLVAVVIGALGLVRPTAAPDPAPYGPARLAPAVLDARAAYSFAWDRDVVTLLNIPLDGSFGTYIDLPTGQPVPGFPSTGSVKWVADLGTYFGWNVWIAGASVESTGLQREHCILIQRDDAAHSRCVPAAVRAQSALLVSVPFASVSADERPVGMTADQRLGFWWHHDRSVTIILGDAP